MVRVWINTSKEKKQPKDIELYFGKTSWENNHPDITKISDAGKWALYEGFLTASDLSNAGLVADNVIKIGIRVDFTTAAYQQGDIYLDDVRIQPLLSEMVCYVYDKAQRLSAVLDDQNFAMIYEYNAEGILVRKLKETVEGVKTISETQYNTQGIPRDSTIQ